MIHEIFLEKFELLIDASNAVQKLREMILQLAVLGKLVPQNPNDKPACELLKLITKERENAIRTKVIRKLQSLSSLVEEELPFDAPTGWAFERFGNLFNFIDYRGKTPEKVESGIRLITAKNIRMGYRQDQPMEFVSEETYSEWMTRGFPEIGDLLFTTEAPMGNVCLVDLGEKFALAQRTINLHPFGELNSQYLMFAIMSPLIQGMISEKATGMTATGIKAAKLKLIPIPLPPLQEQCRIVTKVDQLMALCDELEARQKKKHEKRILLNNAALDKLLTAPTPEKFTQHWQRICDNFDLLYDAPETVGQLRQAILQMAVQGKLVAQDEGDEPAGVLLEKISAEKDQLVKQKKIKRIRALPPIDPQQIPYELPYNWEWVRLGEVGHDCGQKKPDKKFTYIDVSAINKEQGIISDDVDILEPSEAPSRARKLVSKGSVIYATVRPYLLNIAIIDKKFEPEPIVSTAFAVLHPYSGIFNKYLYYYLRSKPFIKYVESEMIGMAYPAINDGKLYMGLVPIPPFAEQKRIVAKVDQLMALCDELEAGLVQAQTDGGKLIEAVVHHVLSNDGVR